MTELEGDVNLRVVELRVRLQPAPHPDIPENAKLFAQITANSKILIQTEAVEGTGTASEKTWRLNLDLKIAQTESYFAIIIFRAQQFPHITQRVLEVSLVPRKINEDGPALVVTAIFSPSDQSPEFPPSRIQGPTFSSYPRPQLISVRVRELYQLVKEGKSIDISEIQLLHTTLLLLGSLDSEIKAKLLYHLGNICSNFNNSKDGKNLVVAVGLYGDAVREMGGMNNPVYWEELGRCSARCFDQVGRVADLSAAVEMFDRLVTNTVDDHPDRPWYLSYLGDSLQRRFSRLGDVKDLNRSIEVLQQAVSTTPDEHPNKPAFLSSLGASLCFRFERSDNQQDIDNSVEACEKALALIPDGHRVKAAHLSNLARSLHARFVRFDGLVDLTRCLEVTQQAVLSTPDDNPAKSSLLQHRAAALASRFERLDDIADLDDAIRLLRDAIRMVPDYAPGKYRHLRSLGGCLLLRFKRLGDLADLSTAVDVSQRAISLLEDDHPQKSAAFINLAHCLLTRYERLSNLADLNSAIQLDQRALSHITNDGGNRITPLHNLAVCLSTRYERLGNFTDLQQAIELKQNVLTLTSDNNPSKPRCLTNLGRLLYNRFKELPDLNDLNRCIELTREALSLTPDPHPERPHRLTALGESLFLRFQQVSDMTDLNQSIDFLQEAVNTTPDGQPPKASRLARLGNSYFARFERTKNDEDLQAARLRYSSAARSVVGYRRDIFSAARHWMELTSVHSLPDEAMEAAALMIRLIPQLTWLGSSISDGHFRIQPALRASRDAAMFAMMAGKQHTAVEWLETGLSVIWAQLLQLRSPLDKLASVYPDLAAKLQSLSSQLDGAGSPSITLPTDSSPYLDYHQLAHERDLLLTEIRQLPDFTRFLAPLTIHELLPAASHGPIVLLNVNSPQSDALIILPGCADPLLVPLVDVEFERVSALRKVLHKLRTRAVLTSDDLDTRLQIIHFKSRKEKTFDREDVLADILNFLWVHIVRPILDALDIKEPMTPDSDVRRLWWCPTGPLAFLPIHAAGVYPAEGREAGPKLSDYVVSSYTPNIATLLRKSHRDISKKRQFLTVALPKESRLPGTAREVKAIVKHADGFEVLPLLEAEATPENVSKAMNNSAWAHFACHGMQDKAEPTESCLLLTGRTRLNISEIAKLSLKDAEFAFLSACETATGDPKLEDEAVHLAAGMLLAGYRGVIATMWRIDDAFAVNVAEKTYELLFKKYGADSNRAAEALHFAIKKECEDEVAIGRNVPLFHWVPFMHLGA